MLLRINNSPSIIEPIVISFAAITAIIAATYMALEVTMANPLNSPLFWVAVAASIIVTYGVIRKASKRTGALAIDLQNKLFMINKDEQKFAFDDLVYYKSSLIKPPIFSFGSRMVITLGLSKTQSFTIMDDRSSIIGSIKNSANQLDAIESLVNSSSITDQQKASFENWIIRARLNQH